MTPKACIMHNYCLFPVDTSHTLKTYMQHGFIAFYYIDDTNAAI